jgi:DNA-binding NtrC family response regulator
VECRRVCVIDNSPAIRETIAIVLGGRHTVACFAADEHLADQSDIDAADLLIVADDALPGASVVALAHGRPVLWLQSQPGPPRINAGVSSVLPHSFTPEDLHAQVDALLTSPRPQAQPTLSAWSVTEYPVFPTDVTQLARRAAETRFPVLICGEAGTGKARLARAIHSVGSAARFVPLSANGCTRTVLQQAASIAAGDLTVFLDDIAQVAPDAQQLLLELLDCGGLHSAAGWHPVRLVCATAQSSESLARTPNLDKELFYRLSVLPIALPPLRDRPHDLPALANYFAAALGRLMSAKPVTFTPRAMDRLTNYLWFGNLAEFETVLTRTATLASNPTIDAEDLLFGYGRLVPRRRNESRAPNRGIATEPAPYDTVDLVINELAHEFKNPMVTIKTVAQHLERLLSDETGRERIARLTGDAVDRMDRVLENLLQFTRFRAPAPQDIALPALLAPCLTDLTAQLSERRVLLNYRASEPLPVFVDNAQITYAFENLLRVIARDLPEGETLSIRPWGTSAAVTFEFSGTGRPLASKLSALLDHPSHADETASPLGLVFAKTLIERNGGRIEVRSAATGATITVWLPSRDEIASGNGKTASLSC